jgi:glycosyl transferase family 87
MIGTARPDMYRRAHRLAVSLAWIAVALALFLLVRHAASGALRRSHGFVAYYTVSRLVREGVDISPSYADDHWFQAQMDRFQRGVSDVNYNPPTTALLVFPLADLPYRQARVAWTLLSLAGVLLACGLIAYFARLPRALVPFVLLLVLACQPLYANFSFGQGYAAMFLLLVVAWFGHSRNRAALLGSSLGLLLVLKLAGMFLVPLLLIQMRWRALAWTGLVAGGLVLGTLPWLGLRAWLAYVPYMAHVNADRSRAVAAYQNLTGFFRHFTTSDSTWNPAPLVDWPVAGNAVAWLAAAGVLAVSLACAARSAPQSSEVLFGAFALLGVILSPLSLDYHYVLALPAMIILGRWAYSQRSRSAWLVLLLATLMIAWDLPYRSPRVSAGVWALLAYPKLYGALMLWGLALWAAYRTTPHRRPRRP